MDKLCDKTKEELFHIIKELKTENNYLRELITLKEEKQEDKYSIPPGIHQSFKEKYATKILETLPDILMVVSYSGEFVQVLSSIETCSLALNRGDIGQSLFDILPIEVHRQTRDVLNTVAEKQIGVTYHFDVPGERLVSHFENRIVPLDENYALCICRNITKTIVDRQKIELANQRMRLAEEIASLSLWYFYEDTCEIEGDGILPLALGLKQKVARCTLEEYLTHVYVDDISKLVDLFYGQFEDDNHAYAEHRVRINGETRYLHTRIIRSYTKEDGRRVREGYVQDMTYVIEHINELEAMRYAINNIVEEVFACSPDGKMVFANTPFIKLHQLTGPISNYNISDLKLFNNTQQEWNTLMELIISEGGAFKFLVDLFVEDDNKTHTFELVSCMGKKHPDEKIIWFFSRDITSLKETEKELIKARYKAEESDSLKSTFLANMSHEIRTPLNAIVGFSKMIIDSEDIDERKVYSEIIDQNTELLLQLINDILDISRIEADMLTFHDAEMDLVEVCRNIQQVLKERTNPGVELFFDCRLETLPFFGDRNRVAQVITNLLTNACKFTNLGEIRFGFDIFGNSIEFFVKDTGIGIAEEKITTIFERFIKLNGFAQGTGLGLSICKMIVEKMGGQINVESKPGEGTIFRFILPYNEKNENKTRYIDI